jgi:hypothetical protein
MPGEIGASMFSPRPGRGYRFHSLQVEIIKALRGTPAAIPKKLDSHSVNSAVF